MDNNKTEEGTGKQNAERPLPRGLEHVSHLFFSHASPGAIEESSQTRPEEQKQAPPGNLALTVVLRPCRLSARQQLVSVLRKQAATLEDGMKAIDANIPCETSGSIELLAVDQKNQLAIIDLDDSPNDGLLLRGIGHFDWIVRNLPYVRRVYEGHVINVSLQPRLFLVAPGFSTLFRSVVRHITSPQIHCFKYHAIALSGGTGIFFEYVFGSARPDRP